MSNRNNDGWDEDGLPIRKNSLYLKRKRSYDHLYIKVGRESDPCVYCGLPSTVWDHVPSLSYTDTYVDEHDCYKYRSCQKCNDTLQAYEEIDIEKRIDFLRKRYNDLIDELDGRLKNMGYERNLNFDPKDHSTWKPMKWRW